MWHVSDGEKIRRRLVTIFGILVLFVAACASTSGTDSRDPTPPTSSQSGTAGEGPAVGAFPVGPSALTDMFASEFPEPLIDPEQVASGGPPPDGIPSIDAPEFLVVAENLDILPANEPVIAVEINGDARAYPVRALVWHEIVNDIVGGVPVAVTYCPLCNSAATYDRRIDGAVTTFGTSGRLFASALVMYDRATETLWTHYDGRAVIGLLTGRELVEFASPLLAWADFRTAYPTGKVLDWTRTGYNRDYGRNPYKGYDDPDKEPFAFSGSVDDRAAAMRRIVGVRHGGESAAYALDFVSGGAGKATNVQLGGSPLVVLWKPGQSSALEGVSVSGGRDVGSVGVFIAKVADQQLTFRHDGEAFVDDETGSRWSVVGEALSGPLEGSRLERVPQFDTFWFAWSTYQPGTTLVTG